MFKAMSSASGPTGGYVMSAASEKGADGTMIAFMLDRSTANHLLTLARGAGIEDSCLLSPEDMHITLALLPNLPFPALSPDGVAEVVRSFARGWQGIAGDINGIGRFQNTDEHDVIYASFDSPLLPAFRQALLYALLGNGIDPLQDHGFTAHATLAYVDKNFPTPTIPLRPFTVSFDALTLASGALRENFPMGPEPTAMPDFDDALKRGVKIPESEAATASYGDDPDNTEDAATMGENSHFAYPEGPGLPMPDAQHVVLAAAALGPKPPHGRRAKIPADKLGEVKARVRARAKELGLGDDEMAKVNAYLSGHMPSDVSEKDAEAWTRTFGRVYALTQDDTKAALAAQGAINRCAMMGRKALGDDLPTSVAGWMMLFSDPDELDLQGTYFDSMTRTLTDYYPKAPLWMEHGKDPAYGADPIGFRTLVQVYPVGIWGEHALHLDHPLYERTARAAADGAFSYSSDSLAHYAQAGYDPDDGHLGEWPLAGCSLTRTPAEPGLGPVQAKSLELALKSAVSQREAASTGGSDVNGMKGTLMDDVEEVKTFPTEEDKPPETKTDVPVDAVPVDAKAAVSEDEKPEDKVPEDEKSAASDEDVSDAKTADDPALAEADMSAPGNTLEALASMYGCAPDSVSVRKAMDDHFAKMRVSGSAHPVLAKALGLAEDAPPIDVEKSLDELYSAATAPKADLPVEPEPLATPTKAEPDYSVLHRHLHSGDRAAKSKGPYMTGEFAQKGVNANFGAPVPGVMEVVYDMMRVKNGMSPKFGSKAMTSATGPTGGYILRQEIVPNVLDPLRAQAVCFRLGATREDMQGLQVKMIPAMQSAPSGNWIGENTAVTTTQPAYRMIAMVPHGYQVTVPIPLNVEANMTPEAEGQIREQMVLTGQLALDLAALTGPGSADTTNSGAQPIGILNTPGVRQMLLATNGRQPTFEDIVNANRLLDQKNVPMAGAKRGLAFHSDVEASFIGQTDSLGRPLLRDSWADAPMPRIANFPYLTENQISTTVTVGSTSNNSYAFFGDWRYMHIGLSDVVELRLDQTFMQNLQVGLLVYFYADVKIVYPDAFIAMTGVQGINITGVTVTTNS